MFTILFLIGIIGPSKGTVVNTSRILRQITAICFLGAIVVVNSAFTSEGVVATKRPSSIKAQRVIPETNLEDLLSEGLYPKRGPGVDPFKDEVLPLVKLHVPGEIRVMVIDTGIGENDKLNPYVEYLPTEDYEDDNGHGTHIAGIIALGNQMGYGIQEPLCPEVRIISCRFFGIEANNLNASNECVKQAVKLKIDVINYSAGGDKYDEDEYKVYKKFIKTGGIAVAAAGNEGSDSQVKPYYPANFRDRKHLKHIFAVQNVANNGNLARSSNYNRFGVAEYGENTLSTLPHNGSGTMTGTSQAAAARTHRILMNACRHLHGVQ
jgi:subtilisin family serine protease